MPLFFVGLLLLLFSFSPSPAAETPLKEGQSFYRARGALLRDGWRPVVTFDKDFDHNDPSYGVIDIPWADARPFWRHGFKEIQYCTGAEANYCGFHYRKTDRCLYVVTAGEYSIKGISPKVSSWWTYPVPARGKCSRDAAETAMPHQLSAHRNP